MAERDLCPQKFRSMLREFGFAYLGTAVDKFVDIRFPKPGHYIAPVQDKRKRMLRRETLAALLDDRAKVQQDKRADSALALLRKQIADAIAPPVLNPPRATLTGATAIRLMAEDLREAGARGTGGPTFKEMMPLGWTFRQLKEYGHLACETAQRLEGAV